MRRELIDALDYPRSLVAEIIEQRDCPHDNLFDATSDRCHHCDLSRDCHWVSCLIEFSDFEGKATHTINASVRYGVNLVEKLHGESQHVKATCECEGCVWIRDAQRLNDAFDLRFATNRYRHLY